MVIRRKSIWNSASWCLWSISQRRKKQVIWGFVQPFFETSVQNTDKSIIFSFNLPGCQLPCLRIRLEVVTVPQDREAQDISPAQVASCAPNSLPPPCWPSPSISPLLPFGDTNPRAGEGWPLLALFPTVDWQPGVPGNDRSHNAPSSPRWRASPL